MSVHQLHAKGCPRWLIVLSYCTFSAAGVPGFWGDEADQARKPGGPDYGGPTPEERHGRRGDVTQRALVDWPIDRPEAPQVNRKRYL